jgi:hypothetical protein
MGACCSRCSRRDECRGKGCGKGCCKCFCSSCDNDVERGRESKDAPVLHFERVTVECFPRAVTEGTRASPVRTFHTGMFSPPSEERAIWKL